MYLYTNIHSSQLYIQYPISLFYEMILIYAMSSPSSVVPLRGPKAMLLLHPSFSWSSKRLLPTSSAPSPDFGPTQAGRPEPRPACRSAPARALGRSGWLHRLKGWQLIHEFSIRCQPPRQIHQIVSLHELLQTCVRRKWPRITDRSCCHFRELPHIEAEQLSSRDFCIGNLIVQQPQWSIVGILGHLQCAALHRSLKYLGTKSRSLPGTGCDVPWLLGIP